jgi:hypothetical protein
MDQTSVEVLYFPNFGGKDVAGIKQSLLLYDRVHLITPSATPFSSSRFVDSPLEEPKEIKAKGALDESEDLLSAAEVISEIKDHEIARKRWDEFEVALQEDLEDQEVLAWEKEQKRISGGKERSWFVAEYYFPEGPPRIEHQEYKIQSVDTKYGKALRVPFLVGMSLGLSEALWAAIDGPYSLFTDDSASQEFLSLRLKRGWRRLTRDRELQQAYDRERDLNRDFAVARLGAWILQLKVPDLIKGASELNVKEILTLRQASHKGEALAKFRNGLADIVDSEGLWKKSKFADFEDDAYRICRERIVPAFEVLEEGVHLKDILKVLDVKSEIPGWIKAVPELFVGTGVPVLTGTGAALATGHPITFAALLALGCGVAAHVFPKLIGAMEERSGKRRNARFLAYPLYLQKATSTKNRYV